MREKLLIANWKMNFSIKNSIKIFEEMKKKSLEFNFSNNNLKIIICSHYLSTKSLYDISVENLFLGVQNITHLSQNEGPFTGEISAELVKDYVDYSIIGHSERRNLLHESNFNISEKLASCVNVNINPILCVGENEETRLKSNHIDFVLNQLTDSLKGFKNWDTLKVAYEPLWAIGTGVPCEPNDAKEMIQAIRSELNNLSNTNEIPILYGGSVSSTNISNLIDSGEIDGALIGSSSMDPEEFFKIIDICRSIWKI
ncbi:MAG: triose-phosphate isomerase [Chloroflexi bacterium]|nr:triose-phosphate isomerase [Chloroflexota bacterium]|tara:strand:- start:1399 stop:2166 length:768 start_codon:yes stop_codon:yes gene_type:complete